MSIEEYKLYCIYKLEHILTWLRGGDYECHILMDMAGVTEETFKDILAIATKRNLVELYDNETKIRIANPGRLYLLNEATDIMHAGEGILHKRAYVGGVKRPEKEEAGNVRFTLAMSAAQTKALEIEMKEHKISKTPKQLILFLQGDNEAKFTVEKLHHLAYLIFRLIGDKLLLIENSTGFFKHLDIALSHRDIKVVTGGTKELKRQVITTKYNKMPVQQDIDKIITRVKTR